MEAVTAAGLRRCAREMRNGSLNAFPQEHYRLRAPLPGEAPVLRCRWILPIILLVCGPCRVAGESLLSEPLSDRLTTGWALSGGIGSRSGEGLTLEGSGADANDWSKAISGLEPGGTYRLGFRAIQHGPEGFGAVRVRAGSIHTDVRPGPHWQDYSAVVTLPDRLADDALHLGRAYFPGSVQYSSVEVLPVQAVHRHANGMELGRGEAIRKSVYSFAADLGGADGSSCRPLVSHQAEFITGYWGLLDDGHVVMHHGVRGARQLSARLTLTLKVYNGACAIEASRDGLAWITLPPLRSDGPVTVELPAELFPAEALSIRLRGARLPGPDGTIVSDNVHVEAYRYEAPLEGAVPDLEGATHYLEDRTSDPALAVEVADLGSLGRAPGDSATVRLSAREGLGGRAMVRLTLAPDHGTTTTVTRPAKLGRVPTEVSLPYRLAAAGEGTLELRVEQHGEALFVGRSRYDLPAYFAADFGGHLASVEGDGDLWWCDSTRKVNPARPVPEAASRGIAISAAGRERQHFQLVLRPGNSVGPVTVSVSDLKGPGGAAIPASAIRFREVAYVPVTTPTDALGVVAEWPDPLPELPSPWVPAAGRNTPLWVTVAVPADTPAGDYRGSILLRGEGWQRRVPLKLHVWGFSLPEHTALRSAFGVSSYRIRQHQNLASEAAMATAWDAYMRDFAEHRLAPYDPMQLAPVGVNTAPDGTIALDTAAFDRAAKAYLDGLGFNAFLLNIAGMGSGTAPNYNPGKLYDHAAGSAEYERLMHDYGAKLQAHLSANGWMDRAYAYWCDEPVVADYPFVTEGMGRLKRHFPRLKRMLTEEFQPPLFGNVDIWCPITPSFDPAGAAKRQAAGEEVWWYICTIPRAPYCGLFIDHPAIEPRLWLWQTWKYHVQGILVWDTTYWNCEAREATHGRQNPWMDPMSYSSPTATWGNGDGRFFYPANWQSGRDSSAETTSGPVDSIRWEMLSAGVQDWDYFRLLEELVKQAESRGENVAEARALLTIPAEICESMTVYTQDPAKLDEHRKRLARAIEALSRSR